MHERSFQGKTLGTSRHEVRRSNLTPKMALLKARFGAGAMTDFDMQETTSPSLCNQTQIRPLEGHETQCLEGPMSMDIKDEAVQKRCVPTPQQMGAKPMAVGT